MQEYKVKGLTCANCTRELEERIQKLDYGSSATLSYNSGKLKIDNKIAVSLVEKILRTENAYLEKAEPQAEIDLDQAYGHYKIHEHKHEHDHGHSHIHLSGQSRTKLFLVAGAAAYLLAMCIQGFASGGISIGLYLFAMAITGYSTFIKGTANLFRLRFNMETLMTIALIGAIAIGQWKEATLVAILFGLNELLEGFGMEKARRSVESLLQAAPKEAILIRGSEEIKVPISELQTGDIALVRSGAQIPSDGTVFEGRSSINEAAITGESLPIDKSPGDSVFGGSINNEGVLKIRIEKAYQDSSLARILHLVEEAQETKTPTELFINRFARYYTPAVMIVAALVMFVPPLLWGGNWKTWLYQGLAVLIVGCPCALIISSPIAIIAGITRNARNGILIKGGMFLEQLGKIKTMAFDKTGTLTMGEPHVMQDIKYDDRLYAIAAAIEKSSLHPLAKAIIKKAGVAAAGEAGEPEELITVAGQGITATIRGTTYFLGNEKQMKHLTFSESVRSDIKNMKQNGLTLVLVADAQHLLGIFGLADEVRPESKEVIASLRRLGILQTVMLTGDHEQTARKVAEEVGVTLYYGNLLPEDKVDQMKQLAAQGAAAMIGDGINDAPALASAQLGIAMGKGTDSAIETADIVLMQDHLGKLPEAISIAKRVKGIIRLNIGIALSLKVIALLLTIPGLLTLWIAILSDMGATILVTLISLTILVENRFPKNYKV